MLTELDTTKTLRVVEMFGPTFQGEGSQVGRACYFLRLAGCDYRCSWCDTFYALRAQDGEALTIDTVWDRMYRMVNDRWATAEAVHVVLTGGNPLLQPDVETFINAGPTPWIYHVETQGTAWQNWVNHEQVKYITLSPKLHTGPMSGEPQKPQTIDDFLSKTARPGKFISIKIVVFHSDDARTALERYGYLRPRVDDWILQVGTFPGEGADEILTRWRRIERDLTDIRSLDYIYVPFRLLPQTHVLLHGRRRGV